MEEKAMKRFWSLVLVMIMVVTALSGCGEQKKESANRLDEILERGYITVAMEPYFAPCQFIDPSKEGDEQYVGSDVEFAKLIAEELGVECRIVPLDFTTVLSSVTEGKYDLAISALAWKPDREQNMNLSNSYYTSDEETDNGYSVAVRTDMLDQVTSIADLEDLVIVVQQGSLQQYFLEEQVPKCKEVKYVSSTNDAFMMVSENKADAVITANAFARLYIEANTECGLSLVESFQFETDERMSGMVVGMKKGEDELTAKINEIIAQVVADGTYMKWYEEYEAYAATLGL